MMMVSKTLSTKTLRSYTPKNIEITTFYGITLWLLYTLPMYTQ